MIHKRGGLLRLLRGRLDPRSTLHYLTHFMIKAKENMRRRFFQLLACIPLILLVTAPVSTVQNSPKPIVLQSVSPEKIRDNKLEQALLKALGEDVSDSEYPVQYYYNRVDLNGDGKPEVLAYVFGQTVCGTGGCNAFVFQPTNNGYQLISAISLARNPIIVSEQQTQGWKDLIMFVAGGGIQPGHYVVLQFNGQQYPENPTLAPAKPLDYKAKGIAYVVDKGIVRRGILLRQHKTTD